MKVGRIEQLTTVTPLPMVNIKNKPNQIDYEYIRLRTQQLMTSIDLSSLSDDDRRSISICMEDIAKNELTR